MGRFLKWGVCFRFIELEYLWLGIWRFRIRVEFLVGVECILFGFSGEGVLVVFREGGDGGDLRGFFGDVIKLELADC